MDENFTLGDYWRMALNSRLLYPKRDEAEPLIRRKLDDISGITDPQTNEDIFERFNEVCMCQCDYNLKFVMDEYLETSTIYEDQDFWAGRKSKSRRDFCKKLFIHSYLPPGTYSDKRFSDIGGRDNDDLLMMKFKDIGEDWEKIDIAFTMLLCYEVIKPYNPKSKFRDELGSETLKRMIKLVEDLDLITSIELTTTAIGHHMIFPHFDVIVSTIELLKDKLASSETLSTAEYWGLLNNICGCVRVLSSPKELLSIDREMVPVGLNGIWIDDTDLGKTRFWIFPSNYCMAFCYKKYHDVWRLEPYEFAKIIIDDKPLNEVCIVTAKGNEEIMVRGVANQDTLANLEYEWNFEEDKEIFKFKNLPSNLPYWLDWKSFERLPKDSTLHLKFSQLLSEEFYPERKILSNLECNYPWMIDYINSFIGIDEDYIYIARLSHGSYFKLELDDTKEENFIYKLSDSSGQLKRNLRELEINEIYPLYVINRNPEYYERFKSKLNFSKVYLNYLDEGKNPKEAEEYAQKICSEFKNFIDVVRLSKYGNQITLYELRRGGEEKRIIYFNECSFGVDLERAIKDYGVIKLTSRKDFILS